MTRILCVTISLFWIVAAGSIPPAAAEEAGTTTSTTTDDRSQDSDVIPLLLKQAELTYIQVPGRPIYLVLVEASRSIDVEQWRVSLNYSDVDKMFINVWATFVDNPESYDFSKDVLLKAMQFNTSTSGAKICIDVPAGDIDARWEVPSRLATPELIKFLITDVAATCNTQYQEFKKLAPVSTGE
ncbi:hypothetical protein JW905_10665 [bacterium]|nr:hypothetical protein [candidate division CSSED10-310 bacterium]